MRRNRFYLSKQALFFMNLGFWAILAGLDLLKYYYYSQRSGEEIDWLERFVWVGSDYLSLCLLSFLIYFIFKKTAHHTWKKFLAIHFPASLVFGVLNIAVSTILMMSIIRQFRTYETPFWEAFLKNMTTFFAFSINGFMIYWLVIIVLLALNFYARYKDQYVVSVELESKLTQSQLQTLKMQLQPHFLFNALNTIAMLVRKKKNDQAVGMISGLSDLLRQSLSRENVQLLPFEEELTMLERYLEIEQIRFQDRLQIIWDIEPTSKKILFPNLLLQPIVENAFKYGISDTLGNAELRIKSKVTNENLYVWVENTGPSLPEAWKLSNQNGIGLANTQARLKQLYDKAFIFEVNNMEPQGVSVHIRIPLEKS